MWYMPVIPDLDKFSQEDSELEVRVDIIVKWCLNKQTQKQSHKKKLKLTYLHICGWGNKSSFYSGS
jgi:hypothetical protein